MSMPVPGMLSWPWPTHLWEERFGGEGGEEELAQEDVGEVGQALLPQRALLEIVRI